MSRAAKICSKVGCSNLQPCPEHPVGGWSRRGELPSNWKSLRAAVMKRDAGVCQLRRPHCTVRATEVHHVGNHDDHRVEMLIAVCSRCHLAVTVQQAAAGRDASATHTPRGRGSA